MLGPDDDQKKVEPHHTVVFDDGEYIKVENKVKLTHFLI